MLQAIGIVFDFLPLMMPVKCLVLRSIATSTMIMMVRTIITNNSGTTVPMIKAAGRGVAETKAPPPPSLGTGDDVIGKGVSLLVVVEN